VMLNVANIHNSFANAKVGVVKVPVPYKIYISRQNNSHSIASRRWLEWVSQVFFEDIERYTYLVLGIEVSSRLQVLSRTQVSR